MSENETLFSDEDIEEIGIIRDLCEGVTVDGVPLTCFDVLFEIVTGKVKIGDLSQDIINSMYAQVRGFNDFWRGVDWFDNEKMESLLPRIKTLVKSELDLRDAGGSERK